MTVVKKIPKIGRGEDCRKERAALMVKTLIQIALMAAVALFFLLSGYITYTDGAMTVELTGGNVIESIFYGLKLGYMNYGEVVSIHIPFHAAAVAVLCVMGAVAFGTAAGIFGLKKEKDCVRLGVAEIVFAGCMVLFYLLCLTCGFIRATSVAGESKPFYKLYEIRPLFLLAAAVFLLAGGIQCGCKLSVIPAVKRFFPFYLILVIPTVLMLIFNVYPSILQTVLAFKNYLLSDGVWGSDWAGFSNFAYILSDPSMQTVIWQTVYLSFLRLLAGIIPAVFFALVFYHISSQRYRSVVQTIVYIPHFFSWVVIYAIVSAFLTPDGVINNLVVNLFHGEATDYLSKPSLFYTNMILSSVWKEAGWGTILFMASLMGIDKSLYEAAAIDGAGVFKKLWHITLPGMLPILIYQIIMSVGNLLKGAGGEQILIFSTSAVQNNKALVIDTWLYWEGLQELKYGLSGAVSFVQAFIGFLMVIGAHKLSQKTVGIGAW